MSVLIENGSFGTPDGTNYAGLDAPYLDAERVLSFDLAADTKPEDAIARIPEARTFRIDFPTSHDGRGNSLARALREAGFEGRLIAHGVVLADQYPLALRCGFDAVEISDALAARMPEDQWREALTRVVPNYQDRLMKDHA
ncbi:DUF934 domain-containing protein [Rhizobiaceae bacterium]|nr:DUF934 domain-containing protein [Rhizobiaceae bacterium]